MTLVEQYMLQGMEKEAASRGAKIGLDLLRKGVKLPEIEQRFGKQVAQDALALHHGGAAAKNLGTAFKNNDVAALDRAGAHYRKGQEAGDAARRSFIGPEKATGTMNLPAEGASRLFGKGRNEAGRNMRIAGGLAAAGALGGGALLARRMMRKTVGQKLVGALKANRNALAVGGAAAGAAGGLAAYRKAQGK